MSSYYAKRNAKVRIAIELMERGWKVFGFKKDESDPMTDYYSPANWDGIATKNGYTLVIDTKSSNIEGERKRTRWNPNYITVNNKDQKRIENLKEITVLRGATPGEEENAKNMIKKIQAKYNNEGINQYETIELYPSYMGNSRGCIWHIEKDGSLIDRGNKLTIFSKVPESYVYDINKMKYKENYKFYNSWEYNEEIGHNEQVKKERELSEEEEKAIKEFKTFILRLERAVNGMNSCGDGTEETEKEGLKQQNKRNLKKVTETITKTILEMQEVERKEDLKAGDVFFENGYGNLKVIEVTENVYKVVKLGSKNRGYKESKAKNAHTSWNKKSVDRGVKNGYLKVYNIVEVEKNETVEKWVRVKDNRKNSNTKDNIKINKKEVEENNINNDNIEITYNEEKNGIEIKFNDKPEKEILNKLKENGFRWHKIKKLWYAKDTEERRSFIKTFENKEESINIDESFLNDDSLYNDSDKIEPGFIFDCHFKTWDLEVEEIKEKLNIFDIKGYKVSGEKFIFTNVSYDEILTIKAINDINKSILFIDKKDTIKDNKEQQEESNIIDFTEKKEQEKTKEMENNFNIDDILNKFDNVEIENRNRLNNEDLLVMEELQKNLDKMREKFKLYLEFYKENKIYNVEGKEITIGIDTIKENFIEKIVFKECESFICKVYSYFKNKYNVTLKVIEYNTDYCIKYREERAEKNLNWFMNELNYNLLLNDIFNQLGGFDFESKEVEEAKEKLNIYSKNDYVKIKGKNLSIKDYVWFDSWRTYKKYGFNYNINEKIRPLFKLISLYETGATKSEIINRLYEDLKSYDDVTGVNFEVQGEKIKGLKIFKNGKITIVFKDGSSALEFGENYLNYSVAA